MIVIDLVMDLFKPNVQALKAKGDLEGLGKAMHYHRDPNICMSALLAMEAAGGETAVKHLIDALECNYMRWSAASSLEKIGQPAIEPLKEALSSKNIYVQRIAQRTLKRLGVIVDITSASHTSDSHNGWIAWFLKRHHIKEKRRLSLAKQQFTK